MSRLSTLWHRLTDEKKADADFFDEFSKFLRGSQKPDYTQTKPPVIITPSNPPDTIPPVVGPGEFSWIIRARGYVGLKEFPGERDNPTILGWAKGTGGSTEEAYDHDSIPWCALFVWAVMREVKLKFLDTLWALDGLKYGVGLSGPALGCIVCFKRDGGGHIAFVVGRDKNGNLMCLGGNQSDAVNIKPFDPDRAVGYRWPSEVAKPSKTGMATLPLLTSDGKVSTNEA